jgi:hypothetical protein
MIFNKGNKTILNGLFLLGFYLNIYPTEMNFKRLNDMLDKMKNFDFLKKIFLSYENICLFIEAIFNISKAFPKNNKIILDYLDYVKINLEKLIEDYDLLNKMDLIVDKSIYFIKNYVVESDFKNKNNMHFRLK